MFSFPTFTQYSVCDYLSNCILSLLAFATSRYLFQGMCHLACKEEPFPRKFQIFPIFVCLFFLISSLPVVFFIVCGSIFPTSIAKNSFFKLDLAFNKCFPEALYSPCWSRNILKEESSCLIVLRVVGAPLESSAGSWLIRWAKWRVEKSKNMHRVFVAITAALFCWRDNAYH